MVSLTKNNDNMAKFEKGNKVATGRPKGVPNKTTQEIKEIITRIVGNQLEHIEKDLDKIRKKQTTKKSIT